MNELNNLHPIVRYGIAAALVRFPELKINMEERNELWSLAQVALQDGLNELILYPNPVKDSDTIHYKYMRPEDFGNKKNAAAGYFIGPHVLTNQNVAGIIGETQKLLQTMEKGEEGKNYELKRSFSPIVAKLNAGNKSMSNPKTDVLNAAFTCVAALTSLKPAAYVSFSGDFSNAGIIPDLPIYDEETGEYPLLDFVKLFQEMTARGMGKNYLKKPTKDKKFPRPDIFAGNYPKRPKSFGIGAVGVIAAIGQWAQEHQDLMLNSKKVLELLEEKPIYIVAYKDTRQEMFGHHLVALSLSGNLYKVLENINRVTLIGMDDKDKFSNPKWKLFVKYFDDFLRFFNKSSWQNFLSYRATYPIEFFQLLKQYFMEQNKYSEEIILSAVEYGKSLNSAAYFSAKQEVEADKRNNRKGARTLKEYKHQVLLQLESIIGSAETGIEIVSRLNSQAGRLSMNDISKNAEAFLTGVSTGQIPVEDARHLITAFMRLSTYDPNKKTSQESENTDTVPELDKDGFPV